MRTSNQNGRKQVLDNLAPNGWFSIEASNLNFGHAINLEVSIPFPLAISMSILGSEINLTFDTLKEVKIKPRWQLSNSTSKPGHALCHFESFRPPKTRGNIYFSIKCIKLKITRRTHIYPRFFFYHLAGAKWWPIVDVELLGLKELIERSLHMPVVRPNDSRCNDSMEKALYEAIWKK